MSQKHKIDYSTSPDGGTCPPGYHFVKAHQRTCESGKTVTIKAHMAKNPKKSLDPPYLSENLYYLFYEFKNEFPTIGKICGFDEYKEVDPLIRFWLAYWRQQGLTFPEDLDPKVVKAMIAYESGFDPKARSKKSTATGLMQVTLSSLKTLSGQKNDDGHIEIKKERIRVTRDLLEDPLIAVAAGTRWMAHKMTLIPKDSKKDVFNMLKAYNQWTDAGEKYAKKVLEMARAKCD